MNDTGKLTSQGTPPLHFSWKGGQVVRQTEPINFLARIQEAITGPRRIAPLVTLRIAFGLLMFLSTIRFIAKGWVNEFYIAPQFHFTFYGFHWIKPLGATGMYAVFGLMLFTSLFIALGFFYRFSAVLFFICFCYVELIDKTFYLNHYYFVSLISFLLILVPANRYFSLDVLLYPDTKTTLVPGWTINIFKLQIVIVYFYAGLAKLTFDWLFHAMPLKIWLPANAHLPVIGFLLTKEWVAYLFSWFGAIFDLTIAFFLLYQPTRKIAYVVVIIFHVATGLLFKIGIFPYVMIFMTIIFFSEDFHVRFIERLGTLFGRSQSDDRSMAPSNMLSLSSPQNKLVYGVLSLYFLLQIIIPLRFLFYPGKLLWTEEGFRFSWRVMLMEKGGTAFFYVKDAITGKESEVNNAQFLTPMQERMMATQPDMILQYAQYLRSRYIDKGVVNPAVRTEAYVTLNGSGSRLFVDSSIDLSKQQESFLPKSWILPFSLKPADR